MTNLSKEFLDLTDGGGEMGNLIRQADWNKSAVGPFENWPQSLRTALSICLGSKFPMFVWWGAGLTVFYNDAYIPFTGFKHPEYLGRSAREQWAEIWHELEPLTEQVMKTGRATWAESMLLFMTRKGFLEETYFTFSYSPIKDETGAVAGIINPCQETTDQIIGERRLKTLHALSSREIKNIQEIGELAIHAIENNKNDIPFSLLYLSDPDGKIATRIGISGLKANTQCAPEILELNPHFQNIWQLGRINDSRQPERIDGLRAQILEELPQIPYEERPDSAYLIPLILSNHEIPAGFLIMGISSRLAFDDRYQEFFALISRQIATHISNVHTLQEEKKRAEAFAEVDKAKTAFFSNVSHEFRTPLTLILGPLDELLQGGYGSLTKTQHEQLDVMHRNALRLLKLVNTLLDFSRIEAGRAQAIYQPLDLSRLTMFLASAFDSAIQRAGMKLIIDCPPLLAPIYVDKDMWEKIVVNLLSNAFKYTLEGEIEVTLREIENNVELRIRDTGTGIPEQELPKIFERFHRIEGSKGRTHEGTGIGLSLVQELVKLHGGSIAAESVSGQGTTFSVKIPTGFAHLPEDKIQKSSEQSVSNLNRTEVSEEILHFIPEISEGEIEKINFNETTPNRDPKKRIVLADDNTDMRNYIHKLLASHYEVLAASNGKEALEIIRSKPIDLVVSDIMMPIMDGVELLRILRADENLCTTPVILLSARAGDESKSSGIELGADDYVTKPFSAKELLARVQTQLHLLEMRTQLLRELENSNQELDAFCRTVSHDLRAPLRIMEGFSKIMTKDYAHVLDQTGREHLERITKSAGKMEELIEGLLKLSRFSRGEIRKQRVDLSKLSEQIISELKSSYPDRKVQYKVMPDLIAKGDPLLLEAVLQNLLRNAWKFTSKTKQAHIQFGSMKKDHEKVFFVQDNGAGFDMKYADKLFGIFQRLHSENEFEGTGVGLATVKRIIQRHNGRIWVEAKPNEGATFYFTL